MDANNVFLHGDLEEKLYMKMPPSYTFSNNKVYKLQNPFMVFDELHTNGLSWSDFWAF